MNSRDLAGVVAMQVNVANPPAGALNLLRTLIGSLLLAALLSSGCTSLQDYIHNGFKVGPQYGRPPAPVAKDWIDPNVVRREPSELTQWWTVFKDSTGRPDPILNALICTAYRQNLTLRQAAFRVLEARAQLAIATGNLFPQTQQMTGDYSRTGLSNEIANSQFQSGGGATRRRWFGQWDYGFNLGWEIDLWGRLRRAIEADAAFLDASVEDYDDVLVSLLADVATNYVQLRTFQERIKYAQANVRLQRRTLELVEGRAKEGLTDEIDMYQAQATLRATEALIPELDISLRQTCNQLCILLGMSPEYLQARLGQAEVPRTPEEVAAGIPADLLRRRPDVRRAERQAAAQCALIGVAEAEFYPHIAINSTFGWSAEHLNDLFRERALNGKFGPSFQWNILNYGRILSNVRFQDARFQESVAAYQNLVLSAGRDVENGLVTFLRAREREQLQAMSVRGQRTAVRQAEARYNGGVENLTRVTLLQQTLVQEEDTLAQAQGEIAIGLIQVYRALGGGWQIRLTGCDAALPPPPEMPAIPEETLPAPRPVSSKSVSPVVEDSPAESSPALVKVKVRVQ
jgi:NodT family efflux transporter outer membrane factor (OMF) lipoprotein